MYTDIRAQLVPIFAAFVALGIGIIIGSMLATDQGLLIEQQLLIEDLEQQFVELRTANTRYQEQLEQLEASLAERDHFLEQAFPVVAPRLAELNIAVLNVGNNELSQYVTDSFDKWGARLLVVNADVDSLLAAGPGEAVETLLTPLTASGAEVNTGDGLDVNGEVHTEPDAVVMVVHPALKDLFGTLLTPLTASLRARNIHLVAVEGSAAEPSLMSIWRKLGVSTVDNADTSLGLLSLALVTEGRTGHYGTGESAERLLPALQYPANAGREGP
jgi:hypothetical protein